MVKKIAIKMVIAILITVLIGFISNSLMPILGNDVALGQLQNDDAYFVAMQAWQTTQQWLSLAIAAVWAVVIALITKDVYIEMKNKKENI